MAKPTFLIIGAGRSGTTSLYHYLKQHPQIFMSAIKETHYFAIEAWRNLPVPAPELQATPWKDGIQTWDTYLTIFEGAKPDQAIGEASPSYIRVNGVPELIRTRLPRVKLVAILRQPADRAFSYYQLMRRNGVEPLDSFAAALEAEALGRPLPDGTMRLYRTAGYYSEQLLRYLDIFLPEQISVHLYDDLSADAVGLMKRVFAFLGVDDKFTPNTSYHHNQSGQPKNWPLQQMLGQDMQVKRWVERVTPLTWQQRLRDVTKTRISLESGLRARLTEGYRQDILRLQDQIHRDLSHWLV